jgi:hypothetical protein
MLKLGVWQKGQFLAGPPDRLWPYLYYRLSRSRVSLRLLRFAERGSAEEVAMFEQIMVHIRLANGVVRATYPGRFRNLDPVVNRLLCQAFSPAPEVRIEDWAASACLTSAEWAGSLFSVLPRASLVASDLMLFLVELENASSADVFVVQQDGQPLQYVHPPFVIRMEPPEPWSLPFNRIGYQWAWHRWGRAKMLWPLPDSWLDADSEEVLLRGGYRLHKLPLVHPRALALARTEPRFRLRRHSVFAQAPVPCHAIRSMNILNRSYFAEQDLLTGIRSVVASLHTGGLWIVGRTVREDPPEHHASILRKTGSGRLELVERFGAGSEIESLALGMAPAEV